MTVEKVKQAAAVLGVDPDTVTQEEFTEAYRREVKKRHPDVGGSAEAFHELLDASKVITKHLERRKPQRAGPGKCPRCEGRAVIESRRAWRVMRVRCPECKGTGTIKPSAL